MSFRSPLPHPISFASAQVTTTGGVRSMLAPWIGGASAESGVTQGGYRGFLGIWVGGGGPGTGSAGSAPDYIIFARRMSRR